MQNFYGHGKLLLTAEYLVLLGAEALALPCRFGQSLRIESSENNVLHWKSYTHDDQLWFEAEFRLNNLECIETSNPQFSDRLRGLLLNIQKLKPDFLNEGIVAKTVLEFDRSWGLGSSSTLVTNLAAWAGVNPYDLLKNSFGGSGYDLACAEADGPICYTLNDDRPMYNRVPFNPIFKEDLYFVYRNQKQSSEKEIAAFQKKIISPEMIHQVNQITQALLKCSSKSEFNQLLLEHEILISAILGRDTIQESIFPNFKGQLKSLGAWGGDFILASGDASSPEYFYSKGYHTVIPYQEMILD